MSFTKKDRKVRSNSGITFPAEPFAEAIAGALHRSYGTTPSSIKTVAALVGANARAVKNWFEAKNAPSGEFVVTLCRYSDEVFVTFLRLAGRTEHLKAKRIAETASKLRDMLALLVEAGY
jgi:hypothetical protein